jgi:hypothetical protein
LRGDFVALKVVRDYKGGSLAGANYQAALLSAAYDEAARAARLAQSQNVAAASARLPEVGQLFEDMVKQAYASYQKNLSTLPYRARNVATGARDGMELAAMLDFERARGGAAKQKATALAQIAADIDRAKAEGGANIAALKEKFALLYAEQMSRAQSEDFARQTQMQKLQNAQQAQRTGAGGAQTPALPGRMDAQTAAELFKQGLITRERLEEILGGYLGEFEPAQSEEHFGREVANLTGDGWVFVPGIGRVGVAELARMAANGEVVAEIAGKKVRYKKAAGR